MEKLEVGKPLPYPPPGKDTVEYNYDIAGHNLRIFYDNPTIEEIENIKKGVARFGLYTENSIIFLIYRFGDLPWCDAPYTCHKVPTERRKVPDESQLSENTRETLFIVLADSKTGIVYALRLVTFSPKFSKILSEEILKQSKDKYDSTVYNENVDRVYKRYENSKKMYELSTIKTDGGE